MNGLISIVIPIYNAVQNLKSCLDSILAQTYKNIEVILVDDGSQDGSQELCKEYKKKDSRIHLIVKKNEGVSAARNVGIQKAKGEFLQFVDSDDTLVRDACERLVGYMQKEMVDVVICGYRTSREQEEKRPLSGFYKNVSELMPYFSNYYNHYHNTINVPWNKLFRRDKIKSIFPEDLSKGEDLLFNLDVLENAKGILFVEDVLYNYNNNNENSLGYRFREDGFEIEERLFEEVMRFYHRHVCDESQKNIQFLFDSYLDGIKGKCIALVQKSGKTRKECVSLIRHWVSKPSVRLLVKEKRGFCKKDKLFLHFIQYRMAGMIYQYYCSLYRG